MFVQHQDLFAVENFVVELQSLLQLNSLHVNLFDALIPHDSNYPNSCYSTKLMVMVLSIVHDEI
jgi:hypothetical protein